MAADAGTWTVLRGMLEDRRAMASEVLREAGHPTAPLLIDINEVLGWMTDLEAVSPPT